MNKPFFTPLIEYSHARQKPRQLKKLLLLLGLLFSAWALSACDKPQETTVGQKLDTVIDTTEQAAVEAKAQTASAMDTAGSAIQNAAQETVETMDDVGITATISTQLAKDPDLSALKINVDTKDGVVTLNGTAPTETAREKATTLAKAVKGVKSVDNKLVVRAG